ncbi:MAG TPA: hypothetical protein VK166_03185 [Chitinophagaceae bacterium]|nr:hypothetical protein [Chitinophagaceae bacterium]
MNWYIIILAGIAAIVLIVFLVKRNLKDEEKFEDQLKEDYHKPREEDVNDTTID